jgi:hypothetical protein
LILRLWQMNERRHAKGQSLGLETAQDPDV